MYDIWDGAVLRNLKGPDGKPFVGEAKNPQSELHLIFNEMLCCWSPGITFMKTLLNRGFGAVIRATIIPLICDLPAAQKTAGFASHGFNLGDLAHCIRCVLGIDADAQPPGEEHVQPHNPGEQQNQLDGVIDALRKESRTGLMCFCRGYIMSMALANNVAPHVNLGVNSTRSAERARTPKSSYIDALLEWAEIHCPTVLPHPTADFSTISAKISNLIILHKGILHEVWSDMAKTTIPLWLKCIPANFSSASHGKIEADQWCTVCLVNLVITLGHLLSSSYLGKMQYAPTTTMQLSTYQRGEIEQLFMKSFCRGSNLRASLMHDSLPEAIADLQHIALDYFSADFRGTLHQDLSTMVFGVDSPESPVQMTKKHIKLSPDVYSSLISHLNALDEGMQYQHYDKPVVSQYLPVEPYTVPKKSIKFKGVNLTPTWQHVGNSQVLLHPTAGNSISCAAWIQKIFLHTCSGRGSNITETFYVVRWYRELSDAQAALDPY
ncbi:uncharacterized protein F5891DRAFT_987244 [Suillus fuscotomentosus]|uniref:Uncharacterized protein n=1 Tax=Suillus fuscotomentosus TaxID=1912939 RepID=A0AAD4HC11_9AGAM|nr:uncharacterized protein F5891DRAFT_987244 [Suillus fuscotomentosus]KAG1889750.1 hypothetical protein F5891DRAFT_987244 [Suillus fuscotomentosus]